MANFALLTTADSFFYRNYRNFKNLCFEFRYFTGIYYIFLQRI